MTRSARVLFFAVSICGFASLYLWALRGLPAFGHYRGPYGDVLNAVGTYERHVTDIVTAVNFDYRGFDTLGEESILFISVVGAVVLLRRQKKEHDDEAPASSGRDPGEPRNAPESSEAVRAFTVGMVGPVVCFGLYIASHGQLTPGGGFQGGVILATAPLLVYLGGDFELFKQITSHALVEVAEAVGLIGYLATGFAGMIIAGQYLRNVVPLGTTGYITSGGTIQLVSLATALEVTGGFVLLLYAFLEQTLEFRLRNQ
ncbi:MAG TPA: MnhB domain-containing protein [Terriglobales bacterium]|nr:MnhB domain-containing protein [Terriglobales bacterium]